MYLTKAIAEVMGILKDVAAPIMMSLFGGGITYLVTRGKYLADIDKVKAEKRHLDLENVQGVIALWQGLVEDLTQDVKELTKEIEQLRKENIELKREMRKLELLLQTKS